MNITPVTNIIHKTNHNQTTRSCNISAYHTIGQSILELVVDSTSNSFNSLNPGIYCVNINGDKYYFDLYIAVGYLDRLYIYNQYNAFAYVNNKKYKIILYKKISANSSTSVLLKETVNDSVDMIVMDGKSTKTYLSDNVYDIRSISSFTISTDPKSLNQSTNSLEILLKNNIKSLPNGVKDTFILNSVQQQNHIIYRIGRKILSGNEKWEFVESGSNANYYLFWMPDDNIKIEDVSNNLNCSHFNCAKGSILSLSANKQTGISTGNKSNGLFIRIPKSKIEYDSIDITRPFKKWLFSELTANRPFIVEYPLASPIYKTVLIDEYHVKTYFPKTYVKIDSNYNVSYFYKSLHTV